MNRGGWGGSDDKSDRRRANAGIVAHDEEDEEEVDKVDNDDNDVDDLVPVGSGGIRVQKS